MDKILSPIKERILKFIDNQSIQKESFFENVGIAPSNFKGKGLSSEIGGEKIVKILSTYKALNPEWLLLGKEPMLTTQIVKKNDSSFTNESIPLIPLNAMAGFGEGEMSILDYECERYVVPNFKGADYLITVKGLSMYPKYNSGDIVACKKLNIKDIFFQWNKVYVIDTDQGPLIKRIKKGKDENYILAVSENADFDPFELPVSKIYSIALVVGCIRME